MIVIDATTPINSSPLGLTVINEEVWLLNFLKIVERAGKLNEVSVYTKSEWIESFRTFLDEKSIFKSVNVSDILPEDDRMLILPINKLYVRRNLTNRLKKGKTGFSDIVICEINSEKDLAKAEDFLVRDQILIISRYINMPVARRIALWLKNYSSITPNQISIASFLTCLAAIFLIATGEYIYGVIAAFVLQIALTLDLSDGYLARLSNRSSKFGAWFDTMLDEISTFAIIMAFIYGVYRFDNSTIWLWLGIFWLITVHTIATNFWYTKATNFVEVYPVEEAKGASGETKKPSYFSVKSLIRLALSIWQSLDGKFYIYSVALLLDQKKAVILLMALERTLALILVFKKRFSDYKLETINNSVK